MEDLNECAERAFVDNAQHTRDSLLYAKLPPHMERSLNLIYLENGSYDQTIARLEGELVLSGLENDGKLSKPTMTATAPNGNPQLNILKKFAITVKKPGHVLRDIRDFRKRMKKQQEQTNNLSF